MISKIKNTILLLFFFMFLLGIVLVDNYTIQKDKNTNSCIGSLLFPSPSLKINHFTFTKGSLSIECVKENEKWFIKYPLYCRASTEKIEQLIDSIFSLRCIDIITLSNQRIRGISPAQYGFSSGSIRISLSDGNKKYVFYIGELSPTKNSLYVMQENNEDIFVVNTNILGFLPTTIEALRDDKLVVGNPATINKIEVRRLNAQPLQITKYNNEWIITKPFFARADWFKVKTMIDSLFKMKILSFVSESSALEDVYGINDDEYLLKIIIFSSEKESVGITFGRTSTRFPDSIYAKRSDENSIVLVNGAFVKELSEGLPAIADSRMLFLPSDIINYVSLSDNRTSLTLELYNRDGIREWFITEPINVKADFSAVNQLLGQLNSLKIMGFQEITNQIAFSYEKIMLKISVGTDNDTVIKDIGKNIKGGISTNQPRLPTILRTLLVRQSAYDTSLVEAMFEEENILYTISLSALSSLQISPAFYQDKTVLLLSPTKIKKIVIRKGQEEYIFSKTMEEKWQQDKPLGKKLNIQYVDDVIRNFAILKAARFEQTEGKNISIYGLSEPLLSVTLILDPDAEVFQKTILIGGQSDDMLFYAMVKGQDTVCLIEKKVVDAVFSLLTP